MLIITAFSMMPSAHSLGVLTSKITALLSSEIEDVHSVCVKFSFGNFIYYKVDGQT